jgi:hypothetical protein
MEGERVNSEFLAPFLDEPYPEYDFCDAVADMEYEDKKEMRRRLGCPRRWDEITTDELTRYKEMLYFLPDRAKLYYFPLYMRSILHQNRLSREHNIDGVFFAVLGDLDQKVLSPEQKRAVVKFLEYLVEKKMVDEPLEVIKLLRKYGGAREWAWTLREIEDLLRSYSPRKEIGSDTLVCADLGIDGDGFDRLVDRLAERFGFDKKQFYERFFERGAYERIESGTPGFFRIFLQAFSSGGARSLAPKRGRDISLGELALLVSQLAKKKR